MKQLKGVNLGNWLVLEKWMSEDLYSGTNAADETYLCLALDDEEKRARLKVHRDGYVTSRDFCNIAARGFDIVRIPVPFFLFEDCGPYLACDKYLDKAFDWALRYNIKILIDLHTVPGSQNGTDNAGICGICQWHTKTEYVDYTLAVLEKMAEKYGNHSALWGIEVLNEPMCCDTKASAFLNIGLLQQHYKPVDMDAAKNNSNFTLEFLQNFYREAYARIRRFMPVDKCVVFHDAFDLDLWESFLNGNGIENVVLDTHQYLQSVEYTMAHKNADTYKAYLEGLAQKIQATAQKVPLILGEWNIQNIADGLDAMSAGEKEALFHTIQEGFMEAMKDCIGWFYWSYKLYTDDPALDGWDLCKAMDSGWFTMPKG